MEPCLCSVVLLVEPPSANPISPLILKFLILLFDDKPFSVWQGWYRGRSWAPPLLPIQSNLWSRHESSCLYNDPATPKSGSCFQPLCHRKFYLTWQGAVRTEPKCSCLYNDHTAPKSDRRWFLLFSPLFLTRKLYHQNPSRVFKYLSLSHGNPKIVNCRFK